MQETGKASLGHMMLLCVNSDPEGKSTHLGFRNCSELNENPWPCPERQKREYLNRHTELKELLGSNSSGKLQANELVADLCRGVK